MIFKGATAEYLNRPLRNLNEMKNWSAATLDRKLAKLRPKPTFITEPRLHQKACFLSLIKLPHNMQLLDMGLGKTKLVLDAFRWLKSANKIKRILVLVPNVVNIEAWRLEVAKHAPDLTVSYLSGMKEDRQEALFDETDICVGTYSGLMHLVCSKQPKTKMRIDDKKLSQTQKLFDGIVWDEITQLMNHRSLNSKIAVKLSKKYKFRVGLTGTPIGRDPQVLWSQFYAVDGGKALGPTLGLFRQAFFTSKKNYWGGVDYKFKTKLSKKLHRLMAHSSIRYSSEECLDLPPLVTVDRPVAMTDEMWTYYHAILDQAKDFKSGNKLIDVEGIFVRLRQITSGFVSVEGKPSPLAKNPKLEALLELIDELPSNEKLVVFNEFVWSGDQIVYELKRRKIKSARLYSGVRDKCGQLRRFMEDPACQVFVVNSQSGAQGLNLQMAHYVCYYESPVRPIVRQQSIARCRRQGQKETVFAYDLFCKNTVDQKILRYLAEGKDLFEALVEGGVKILQNCGRLRS